MRILKIIPDKFSIFKGKNDFLLLKNINPIKFRFLYYWKFRKILLDLNHHYCAIYKLTSGNMLIIPLGHEIIPPGHSIKIYIMILDSKLNIINEKRFNGRGIIRLNNDCFAVQVKHNEVDLYDSKGEFIKKIKIQDNEYFTNICGNDYMVFSFSTKNYCSALICNKNGEIVNRFDKISRNVFRNIYGDENYAVCSKQDDEILTFYFINLNNGKIKTFKVDHNNYNYEKSYPIHCSYNEGYFIAPGLKPVI